MGERYLEAEGGTALCGEIEVQGSKNAVLPILAGCLLGDSVCVIENCPSIGDVNDALQILRTLGCSVQREGGTVRIDPSTAGSFCVDGAEAVRIRSSVLFLGALLGKIGKAVLPLPGGCAIGSRPVDLHLDALEQLGAVFSVGETITGTSFRLQGSRIRLRIPSVGATENTILAAVQAEGETVIENAAREPEVDELCIFLNRRGAQIFRRRDGSLSVRGTGKFLPAVYRMRGDRIVAGTYLLAAAATGGEILVRGLPGGELGALLEILTRMGARTESLREGIRMDAGTRGGSRLRPVPYVETSPYPGFPTDLQSILMAVLCGVPGKSCICETVFESRFRTARELRKMGAQITVKGNRAWMEGRKGLGGAAVDAPDLRGGAALVVAALQAEGTTVIRGTEYIERGYEDICRDLGLLGARIRWRGPGENT